MACIAVHNFQHMGHSGLGCTEILLVLDVFCACLWMCVRVPNGSWELWKGSLHLLSLPLPFFPSCSPSCVLGTLILLTDRREKLVPANRLEQGPGSILSVPLRATFLLKSPLPTQSRWTAFPREECRTGRERMRHPLKMLLPQEFTGFCFFPFVHVSLGSPLA